MNAYELADFIETGGENIDRKELANMLREQADRIAEYERDGKLLMHHIAELSEEIKKLKGIKK
jgi:hypothetical protein